MFNLMTSLSIFTALAFSFSAPLAQAKEVDVAQIQSTLAENKEMKTEEQAAKILIAYADLMSYLAGDLFASSDVTLKTLLPEVESTLRAASHSQSSDFLEAAAVLQSQMNQLTTAVVGNNNAIQNISVQITSMNKLKGRFPNAKYTATLDLLIGLTREFASNHMNYTNGITKYGSGMSEAEESIRNGKSMSQSAKLVGALSTQRQQVEKYSFTEIGQRFDSISSVLKMLYNL